MRPPHTHTHKHTHLSPPLLSLSLQLLLPPSHSLSFSFSQLAGWLDRWLGSTSTSWTGWDGWDGKAPLSTAVVGPPPHCERTVRARRRGRVKSKCFWRQAPNSSCLRASEGAYLRDELLLSLPSCTCDRSQSRSRKEMGKWRCEEEKG
ncbi:hypothetical protein IWX50DRAFT_646975 [Phyllosticta citricarpa]|uniref:Uncharacterized protein n=1 Tax=Phyllosticta citricarpa TaxID=55181 RepID=A0ABR1MFX4_9PEZI